MTIEARMEECRHRFDELKLKRDELTQAITDCENEMHMLRGEYRGYEKLKNKSGDEPMPPVDPLTITAEAAE